MKTVTIITFNYGNAGCHFNGPGVSLVSFAESLRGLGYEVNVFSKIPSTYPNVKNLRDTKAIKASVKKSEVLHHWSGISLEFVNIIKMFNNSIKIISGPNLIDTVNREEESRYLEIDAFSKILTVNHKLKSKIARLYGIDDNKIDLLRIAPNLNLWEPVHNDDGTILWKGNSRQMVKDVDFALLVAKNLPQFKFKFIGYPSPYNYSEHIRSAKQSHIYFSTSLSETMGCTIIEQLYAKIPCIIHPKINLELSNRHDGIVVPKTLNAYCEAIEEVMSDSLLYDKIASNGRQFVIDNLKNSPIDYARKYLEYES